MAKKRAKAANLPKMCDCLINDVGDISVRLVRMWSTLTMENPKRAVDPCAAEQQVFDAAVQIAADLLEAATAATEIAMAANQVLMQCRMRNP